MSTIAKHKPPQASLRASVQLFGQIGEMFSKPDKVSSARKMSVSLNEALQPLQNHMSLAELELSVRATNCLESEGITTVRDLVIRTDEELLEVRNFGETTLREVKQKLTERGLNLGMKIPVRR